MTSNLGIQAVCPAQSSIKHGRSRQIDGLRAIAMMAVLYVHFFDGEPTTENIRVSLFFLVSGFVITHILMTAKSSGQSLIVVNFYVRRALRLFPALAILIAVAAIFDMDGLRSSAFWHMFQLSNVYYSINETQHPWVTGHLWSLNVTEQFYLLAPIFFLLLSTRQIFIVSAFMWLIAIFLRVNQDHLGSVAWFVKIVLPFDPIYAGVLIYVLIRDPRIVEIVRTRTALVFALIVMISPLFMWKDFGHSETYRILIQPALAVVVAGAYFGYNGFIGRLLGSAAAQFVANISFGVYVYHIAIWWFVGESYPEFYTRGLKPFLVLSTISILVATISWYVVERPIARLKDHFPTARGDRNNDLSRLPGAARYSVPASGGSGRG